ncbi:MAG TPA: TatD family deoxyribonuclease [Desulfobacterales bacterium]|nr:TatD family deoxyribonuclease [Desulfobacterales bacterium]
MEDYSTDRLAVIQRAARAGVSKMMTIGIDLPSSRAALRLAESNPGIFCAVGIHPHSAAEADDAALTEISRLAQSVKVRAVGEIGLDYAKMHCPAEEQIIAFRRQLELAAELKLPVIIHDREAHEETMAILRQAAPFQQRGVMHCFSGDLTLAREVVDLGLYVSLPGVLTFNKTEALREVAREIPLESLIVETDAPFLTPAPYRGKRNEPAYALYTAQCLSEIRGITLAEVAAQTTLNCERLFTLEGK